MGTFSAAAKTTGSNAARDAAIDAIGEDLNNGLLRIYGGSVPADADAALGGATLLAELTLNADAFAAASGGVATANSITGDSSADATGAPTFFRLLTSGAAVRYQGDAGPDGGGAELELANLTSGEIVAAGAVTVSSLTITQTASYA